MKRKYLLFTLFIITGLLYVFFFKGFNKKATPDRVERAIEARQVYKSIANLLERKIDTTFYALYRSRGGEYFFNYIENDSVKSFFKLSDTTYKEVAPLLQRADIKEIYRYTTENFYRFNITSEYQQRIQILVLPNDEKEFIYRKESQLSNTHTVSNTDKLFDGDRKLFIVDQNMRIYRFRVD